jgi:probable F420-dependent oxidoreductase
VEIGVMAGFGPGATPEYISQAAIAAETHGLHSIWVPEHVLFFPEYASRYPYSADGKLPGNPNGVLEPFTALTFIAAHTTRIRLGTGICLLPQRNPVYTAKQVADLDYLSGGRVDLGVGIGWLREEFDALGVPWERRAARTRECVGVMKTLWCDEVSRYEGEFFSVPPCLQNPKPVQRPHPPIHFGGESDAALRRVAELGQGWYGFNLTPEALAERLGRLDGFLSNAGRSRDEISISVAPYGQRADAEQAKAYRDLGVDQLIVGFFARAVDGLPAAAERIAQLSRI